VGKKRDRKRSERAKDVYASHDNQLMRSRGNEETKARKQVKAHQRRRKKTFRMTNAKQKYKKTNISRCRQDHQGHGSMWCLRFAALWGGREEKTASGKMAIGSHDFLALPKNYAAPHGFFI